MKFVNSFGKMFRKLFVFVLLLSVFCFSVNALMLTTTPSTGSTTVTSNSYEVVAEVQNNDLNENKTNVTVTFNIDSDPTGLSVDSNSVDLGTMNTFTVDDGTWNKQATFNVTFNLDSDKDFNITITVSSDQDPDVSSSFTLSYDSLNEPNIYVESQDVSTIALDEFDLPITVYNNGTGDKTIPFNVTVEYDDTLFDFVQCSDSLTCDDSTSGKVIYEVSSLNSNASESFNMTFNATDDKGYSYSDDMKITALTSTIYPTITINPVPVYEVNITQIYNSSSGIIDIITNNLNVVIPVKIRNIGNEILSSLNIVALVEGDDLGETSVSNLAVGAYSSPSYTYEFGGEGLYNVTVNVTGSNNVTDFDFKTLNISFSFNDTDGDGYFALANGGLDCNNNNVSIYPGAPEICGDGIDQDCNGVDLTCSSGGGGGGGSHRDDDDEEEVVPPTEKNVTIEEDGAVVETLLVNVPLNFEISSLNEEHSITLLQISDGYVAFEIQSEPISVILAEGESENIDVDRDGFYDITLTVNRIVSAIRARITIEEYVEPVEVIDNETGEVNESIDLGGNVSIDLNQSQNNDNETIEPEFGKFVDKFESFNLVDFLIIFVLALFIVLVIIGIIVRVNKGNEKSRGKDSQEENMKSKKKVSRKE